MNKSGQIYYNAFMFPFEKLLLRKVRKSLIPKAKGNVLEIGFGTGVNLRYYDHKIINKLTFIDKNPYYHKHILKLKNTNILEGNAMNLPFDDQEFDTVVFTLVFCSVENPGIGLSEVKRVLKDSGRIIFIEHVMPKGKLNKRIVKRVNRHWNAFSGGCNINRHTAETITESGFAISESDYFRKGVFISGTAKKESYNL